MDDSKQKSGVEQEEQIRTVFENEKMRIEEIISYGAVSPASFWYKNPIDEWVSVTDGSAILEFESGDIALKSGENHYIKANLKHRVKYTSQDCKWLCIYIKDLS